MEKLVRALRVDSIKYHQEDTNTTNPPGERDWVCEKYTGNDEWEELSSGHDDGENDWTKLLNGVKDEELTSRACDGEKSDMIQS